MTNTYYVLNLDGLAKVDTIYDLVSLEHNTIEGTILVTKKEVGSGYVVSRKYNDSKFALVPAVVYDYA